MQISKVFNNNVVAIDANGQEQVVMGRGIAFQKRPGDPIDQTRIEKIFTLESKESYERFVHFLNEMPTDEMETVKQIVRLAEERLKQPIHDSLYVTLADHLHFALSRYQDGIQIRNPLVWEVKRFYAPEFAVGKEAVKLINAQHEVNLDEDEAVAIALHLVNATMSGVKGENLHLVTEMTKATQAILTIITYHFQIELDEESYAYSRFLTHLKYFVQRLASGEKVKSTGDETLFLMVKQRYPEAFECVEKIAGLIATKYRYDVSMDERLYMMIHIENLMKERRS
ncbi:PRD domain-containing protein [Exiguobacterium profundum]|uniref:BglG family transcription antiterminator LicT n=1 Tax=Exiguobacterium TaxID=33986 RepID=UPI00093ADEDF|nr:MULTISPECIES: PRD domain-containing protein [Exiguobacterium]MBG0918837.1 PRD domain-containing protein [Exiguobacterium sp. SRB7LM]MDT0193002.1 PRD domain-containing protein [Exiguobacterium sp. BG5(2022)]MDX5982420.1 PRD domain-containing protein [Exiguobacterium profundum]